MRTITLALTLLALTLAPRVHAAAGAAIPGEVYIAPGTSGTKAVPSSQTTNLTVSVNSTAGDGTNAFRVNAATTHMSGNLVEVRNNGTNINTTVFDGGQYVGPHSFDWWGSDPGIILVGIRDADFGETYAQVVIGTVNGPIGDKYFQLETSTNLIQFLVRAKSGRGVFLRPDEADGGEDSFQFITSASRASGNLFTISNNGTNYVQVPTDKAATNAPLTLNINGTQKRVHVGAIDSGGTGLRALTIEN